MPTVAGQAVNVGSVVRGSAALRASALAVLDSALDQADWVEVTFEQIAAGVGADVAVLTAEFGSRVGLGVAYVVYWLDAITVLEPVGTENHDPQLSTPTVRNLVEPVRLIARRRILKLARLIADTHPGVDLGTAITFLESLVVESAANVLVQAQHAVEPAHRLSDYLTMLAAG